MRYAILDSKSQVVDVREWDVLPPHKPGRILPIVDDAQPGFDPATQKLESGSFVVESTYVRQAWQIVELNGFEVYNAAIAAGFPVQPEGYILRLGDSDRVQFSQMLALVKEALDLGMITNDTPQTIADSTNTTRHVSTLRFRQIMVAYGLHYKTLWDNLASSNQ